MEKEKKHPVLNDDINNLTIKPKHDFQNLQHKTYHYTIPAKNRDYDINLNAIGIDLGTTECCTAVIRKHGPDFVALDPITLNRTLPSYVGFDEKEPKCGQIVVDRMRYKAEYSAFDSKRIIGKTYDKVAIDSLWPFKIKNSNGNALLEIKTYEGNRTLKRPEEISAELLKHIKTNTEQYQGKILTEAVITIPSKFSAEQKQATKMAAELAGWQKIHFLPEPVAAAFAYFSEMEIPNQSNIFICDCGGGTTDICIAKVVNEEIVVLNFYGDSYLGGRDFDKVLFNHFNAILKHKYNVEIKEGNKKYVLSQKCKDVKHNLSATLEDWLTVDNFICDNNGSIIVSREEFEELSSSLLLRIKNVILNALSKTDLHHQQINYVFQVGGGCRMPMIKKMLNEIFPHSNHQCSLYPDWIVAHGAALYAYYLKTTKNTISHLLK
uniref:Heat shock protein 70 n=1 Tax=Panagrolaimus sp. PS1159 TaxID=55785 RepID=A0AC35F1A4_9BILA